MNYKLTAIPLLIGLTLSGVYPEHTFAQTWYAGGSRPQDYEMGGDPTVTHGSENAGFIRSKVSPINGFGTWMTNIDPGEYLGKGIRMSAYVRTTNVQDWVGLWMRIDGADGTLSFDNMSGRPITGTTDWQEYEIILDVPENSTGIFFGLLMSGTGEAWVDGLRLEPTARVWGTQNSGILQRIFSIEAVDQSTVWAGAENGVYLRTTDGGSNWTSGRIPGATSLVLNSVAAIDADTAYFLGTSFSGGDTRIYKTTDAGATWTMQYRDTSPGAFLNSIAFWDDTHGIAEGDPVGGSFTILTTSNGGADWNRTPAANIPPPLPGELAGFGDTGGTVLAVEGTKNAWFGTGYVTTSTQPIRVFRSTDRGQNWEAVNTPLSTTGRFTGVTTIAFKDSLTGFAGGGDYRSPANTLVQTTDGGKSWTAVSSFLPITPSTLVYVPQTDNSVLFVTGLGGSGFSEDGGTTWNRLNTQRYSALSFASPTAGWATNAEPGQILRFLGNLTTAVVEQADAHPEEFQLLQNHPNPYNPSTTIRFMIARQTAVKLQVFDILGREVATLVNDVRSPGAYSVVFEAGNLPSGVYLYRIHAGDFVQTKKMTVLK
jgi:photosystem II stability/assembly factor-like uncharacterized protein